MYFKSIFQGNLHFGNQKSFEKVVKMYEHRVESYYKSEVLFEREDVFHDEDISLEIPRYVINITVKNWKNTVDLLTYVSQFAVAGNIGAWMIDEGKLVRYAWIEPQGDKAVVQVFLKGRKLIEKGKEREAEEALTKAIEIYNKHAQAYERRGYVNYILERYHDAERDFTKSINLDKSNAPAYYGRARIKMRKEAWQEAIEDLTLAVKTSLALQDIHWTARRLKADCHIHLKQYKEAEFELRFFTKRKFKEDSNNLRHIKGALFKYGKVLLEMDDCGQAIEVFDKVLSLSVENDVHSQSDKFLFRGIARKKCGKNGFISDWTEAAKLGSKKAAQLLKNK
jgi:tetratricopeptide (TPR) repeat protein